MTVLARVRQMSLTEKITFLLSPKVRAAKIGDNWQIQGKFSRNCFRLNAQEFDSPEAVRQKIAAIFPSVEKPFIANVNYEGGNFAHFNFPGLTPIPSHLALGATGNPALVREVAQVMARELKNMGFTWNLAPVAELLLSPQSRVLGIRSFGSDSRKVAQMTAAFVAGLQGEGVAATVKHFPGILNVGYDFHDRFPLVTDKITEDILRPFRAAIEAGVAMFLPMYAVYSSLDPLNISTFSKKFVEGLIREKLGYQGVIVSDALIMGSMRSLLEEAGPAELILRAWEAGVDLVLLESDISFGSRDQQVMAKTNEKCRQLFAEVLPALHSAIEEGRISESRLNDSVARVMSVYQRYGLKEMPEKRPDEGNHQMVINRAAKQSVTVLSNQGVLPLDPRKKVVVVLPKRTKSSRADCIVAVEETIALEIRKLAPEAAEISLGDLTADSLQSFAEILQDADYVIFKTYFAHLPQEEFTSQLKLIKHLKATCPNLKIIVISTGTPFEFSDLAEVDAFLATYDFREPSMRVASEIIFGQRNTLGTLPVVMSRLPEQLRVSVIMPTLGGRWLPTTLSYLKRETALLEGAGFEPSIIVALDGQRDSLDLSTGNFLDSSGFFEVIENPAGRGKLNNLRHATAQKLEATDFFVYVDDDVLFSQGSLLAMLNELKNSQEQSYLIGAVPVPFVRSFSLGRPWGSLLERIFSFNRRDDLEIFPPVNIPWGQVLAFSAKYYPHVAVDRFLQNTNDSFFMVANFFPRIKVCPDAFYYFGSSSSFLEYLARKIRVFQGVESVFGSMYVPFASELKYFYEQEMRVSREAVAHLSFSDYALFLLQQANQWLVRNIYRAFFKGAKGVPWRIPQSTKNFVTENIFQQLYQTRPKKREYREINFAEDLSDRIKPTPEVEILMME